MNPVESYIYNMDTVEQEIASYLHDVFTQKYGMTCKLRYHIPFYDINKWVCYINPQKKTGVELCFLHGRWMSDECGLLEARGRTQIKGVIYHNLSEINEEPLMSTIDEAIILDKEFSKSKKLPR